MAKKIDEFLKLFQEKYPQHSFEIDPLNAGAIVIPAEVVPEIFEWMHQDPELDFDYFDFSTCVDHPPDYMDMVYYMRSCKHAHRLGIKLKLPRDNPTVPTISHLWANAEWNEREVYDLFGVFFPGHQDLRRIMMPDDWIGHPLRKDYMHPNIVTRPD